MQFTMPPTRANSLPATLVAAHMRYMQHYREYRRSIEPEGEDSQWDWVIVMIFEDADKQPTIQSGPSSNRPSWLKGRGLTIITECGYVLDWAM